MKRWIKRQNEVTVDEILGFLDSLQTEYLFDGERELRLSGFSTIKNPKEGSIIMAERYQLDEYRELLCNKHILIMTEIGENGQHDFESVVALSGAKEKYYMVVEQFFLSCVEEQSCEQENYQVQYGDNVVIEDYVSIIGNVVIGNNVFIKSGAVIGSKGFGFYEYNGVRREIPSIGSVVIGNNVEIGANTCVDSGMLGDTYIEDNVKIANLCHIAHDVTIGNNTLVAARTSVSAGTEIGKNCFIGAGATIKDNIYIGNDNFIGLGSVVKDHIRNRQTVFGNPAVEYVRKKKLLHVSNINKTFSNNGANENRKTLENISFDIMDNEFVSLVGPSGCGKTTLLHIISGLLKPEEGTVNLEYDSRKQQNINMVFQEDALFPWLNLEKNILLGLTLKGVEKKVKKEKAAWVLELVGLTGYEKYYPHQLSGGMKKRAAIARCLVLDSTLLLMDEPFGALDLVTKTALQKDLLELKEKEGFAVCMVTHDIEEAILLSNRIVVVKGKPAQISEIIKVELPYPRDKGSDEFQQIKEKIVKGLQEQSDEI